MTSSINNSPEFWKEYCDFLKLDIDGFIEIQNNLLLKQIQLLKSCNLGNKLLRGNKPNTVEDFRKMVPLTDYGDYFPELVEKREVILPAKPVSWVHSSGRSSKYPVKWIPITEEYKQYLSRILYCIGTLASIDKSRHIPNLPKHPKMLYSVAPPPYISGLMIRMLSEIIDLDILPPIEVAEKMTFEERISVGFQQALSKGLDYFFGLSLVLVKVGEKIRDSSGSINIWQYLNNPRIFWRLTRGMLKSKLSGRKILPKDIWAVKGIISSGIDSWVYKDKIKELWGKYPLDIYSCTEGGIIATQTWDFEDMTFISNLNFLEFIPEEEIIKWQMDHYYTPKTVLLNEVKTGESYELVITNFHGGILVRYRMGDIIRITSLKNIKTNINIPQMVFERRIDDLLGFFVVRLNEKMIWQAIERLGIAYEDWIAYKQPGEAVLNLLIELKGDSNVNEEDLAVMIHRELYEFVGSKDKRNLAYDDLGVIDFQIKVSILLPGTFAKYISKGQIEGVDLAHLKPPHIHPSEKTIGFFLSELKQDNNSTTDISISSPNR